MVNSCAERSLHTSRSRELRGGILYTDCFCLRRNGLQSDCRRTSCNDSPGCTYLPAPLCQPADQACVKHAENPHADALTIICNMRKESYYHNSGAGHKPGRVVCLKQPKLITRPVCVEPPLKQPELYIRPGCVGPPLKQPELCIRPGCVGPPLKQPKLITSPVCVEPPLKESELCIRPVCVEPPLKQPELCIRPGCVRPPLKQPEISTRPGCVRPPLKQPEFSTRPGCVWDMPCKAVCFDAPPGIQPGRNPWAHGSGACVMETSDCCEPSGGGAESGQCADEMPVFVMKPC